MGDDAATTPNPGSDTARDLGCKCPVLDNNHGRFPPLESGEWYVTIGCPVHSVSPPTGVGPVAVAPPPSRSRPGLEPDFEGSVGISRGLKVYAQRGRVIVAGGRIRLIDTKGRLIAESPTDQASAKVHNFGGGCYVSMNGSTYYLRFNIGVGTADLESILARRKRAKRGRALQALLGSNESPGRSER